MIENRNGIRKNEIDSSAPLQFTSPRFRKAYFTFSLYFFIFMFLFLCAHELSSSPSMNKNSTRAELSQKFNLQEAQKLESSQSSIFFCCVMFFTNDLFFKWYEFKQHITV